MTFLRVTLSGLEHLQEWGVHKLFGEIISVPHHPHITDFLPNI